jgi:acetolactate synthase regulatory subunit
MKTKASLKPKRTKKTKSETRVIEHRSLGQCAVHGIYVTDAGGIVVDADVAGERRVLSLAQEFWLSQVDVLRLEAVKRKPAKAAPAKDAASSDSDEGAESVRELEPDVAGHLSEDEPEDEAEVGESETEPEELVGADA